MKYVAEINGREIHVEVMDEYHVSIDGEVCEVHFDAVRGQMIYSLLVDGISYEVNIVRENGDWEVLLRGMRYSVRVEDERERKLRATAGKPFSQHETVLIQAPMPGLVVEIPVREGQTVQKGDVLLVLESMKMQNELTAPREGRVSRIMVKGDENVERKQTLVVIE